MSRTEIVPLHRLLDRQTTAAMLQSFAALEPEVELAVVHRDGRPFAGSLAGMTEDQLAGRLEQALSGQPIWEGAGLFLPLQVESRVVGVLVAHGPGLSTARAEGILECLRQTLEALAEQAWENRSLARETLDRYREINLLYTIGETISTCLDPDEIPHRVLDEAARVIQTDTGAVLLYDERETLVIRSGFGEAGQPAALYATIGPLMAQSLHQGKPSIFTADQLINPVTPLSSALCAPLKTRERILGLVLLGRLGGRPVFTASDQKLLTALTTQAANAVENARLFANLRRQRDAIAAMKSYMDNIFASIASGVITTDVEDLVTTLNRAAERILGVTAAEALGQPYRQALPTVGAEIADLVEAVKQEEQSVMGHELQSVLPERGPVVLRLHLSPLKDNQDHTTGIAIVADDLTEHRQLERQVRQIRETFKQYVAPRVVEQLLSNPTSVRLGGARQEITTLYADVRDFTGFSERTAPEQLIEVLNRHLTLAAEAVLAEEGTLDKFVGDAVMAVFNVPLAQADHAVRAVRAALRLQQAIADLHAAVPPTEQLSFGVGVATGPGIVGNIGSTSLRNYTALGDCVNLAWRLQSQARPGQILLNEATYERVREHVITRELGPIEVKGYSEPALAFEVLARR